MTQAVTDNWAVLADQLQEAGYGADRPMRLRRSAPVTSLSLLFRAMDQEQRRAAWVAMSEHSQSMSKEDPNWGAMYPCDEIPKWDGYEDKFNRILYGWGSRRGTVSIRLIEHHAWCLTFGQNDFDGRAERVCQLVELVAVMLLEWSER